MTTTLIKRRICLDPQFLDSNIMTHLFDKIKECTEGDCTLEYGYILGVNRLVEVEDSWISSANSDIVFNVIFEAVALKPSVGDVLSGVVCMIFQTGILLDVNDKLKFLIPEDELREKGYELNKAGMYYKNGDTNIKRLDELDVRVVELKYKDREFMCFGSLV